MICSVFQKIEIFVQCLGPLAIRLIFESCCSIESPYLSFGGFEWNVAVLPFGSPSDNENPRAPKVLLNRLTGV